jgi:hypothetical protein
MSGQVNPMSGGRPVSAFELLVKDIEDIKNIVLDSRGGTPICVSDVAKVEIGNELRQGAVTKDGQGEVVTGIVLKRISENTKQVIERIKEKVSEINKALPEGVTIVDFYDQAELVDNSIHTVVESLIEGEALVLVILVLLLGDFRSSLITAAAIPFCMLVAFILMWYSGLSANLMSLGGLAISIGMMVDATVVMVENIYRHLEEHREHSIREAILGCRPGNRATDVLRCPHNDRRVSARLHSAGHRRQVIQAAGLCGHLLDDWLHGDGALHSANAVCFMVAAQERRGPAKPDHWILQRDLRTRPQVGHPSPLT